MTTSVSRRLNILCIMFKIIAFFIIKLFSRLYVRVGILLWKAFTCPHHFTKREGFAHKTSLTPPLVIEVPVPSQGYLCARGIDLTLSRILIFDIGIVPTMWHFVFDFIIKK